MNDIIIIFYPRFTLELKIHKDDLLDALNFLSSIVERRHSISILSNVKCQLSDKELVLTGSDLEIQTVVRLELNGECITPGETTIPFRKLYDICKSLPNEAMIKLENSDNRCLLQCNKSKFTISTLSALDYPLINLGQRNVLEVNIQQGHLKTAFDKVAFSMAVNDVRFYLTGTLLEVKQNSLKAITTDGHRLSCAEVPSECPNYENALVQRHIIAPKKAVMELNKLMTQPDQTVNLKFCPDFLSCSLNYKLKSGKTICVEVTSKLIDGKFPDYERVIPRDTNKVANIDTSAFKQALQRVAILSNEKLRSVSLSFTEDNLTINGHNTDNDEAKEELSIGYQNDDITISFNAQYLIDIVNTLNSQEVEMCMSEDTRSTLVMAKSDSSTLFVVMPMRV